MQKPAQHPVIAHGNPRARSRPPLYTLLFPAAAFLIVAVRMLAPVTFADSSGPGLALAVLSPAVLAGAVFGALFFAEVVSDRLGQPYGTLILTISVTAIEVTIVVSMMLHADPNPTLVRDAVFSVVMIVCGGLVGICLIVAAINHPVQGHQTQATSAYLSVLMALSVLTLVLPNYTIATRDPTFSRAELIFAAIVSALLYGAFLFAQTVRHRGDFVEPTADLAPHDAQPDRRQFMIAVIALPLVLLAVVLLAEYVGKRLEDFTASLGLARPDAVNGAIIATLVLLPEGLAAVRAARRNALQTSLNIALGSALATIGLTIPSVAIVALIVGHTLVLGLDARNLVLLLLALGVSLVSFGTGRTNILHGAVHLVVFAIFLLLVIAS